VEDTVHELCTQVDLVTQEGVCCRLERQLIKDLTSNGVAALNAQLTTASNHNINLIMYKRKELYDTFDFYRGKKKEVILDEELCANIIVNNAVAVNAHIEPAKVTPLKEGVTDISPKKANYQRSIRLEFDSTPDDSSIGTSDLSFNNQSLSVYSNSLPVQVNKISADTDVPFVVEFPITDHNEYFLKFTQDYKPNKKPNCVQTNTRDMHIVCASCALDGVLPIEITESHWTTNEFISTRLSAPNNPNYSDLDDPNIANYVPDVDVSWNGPIPSFKINGVDVNIQYIMDIIQASVGPGRQLGGTVAPLEADSVVSYDAVLKMTGIPIRYGPIWKDTEINMFDFQVFRIPKIQGIAKVTGVLLETQLTGIDLSIPLPGILDNKQDPENWFCFRPPWPTKIISESVKITLELQEVGDSSCTRTVAFNHWVDAKKDPVVDLALMGPTLDPAIANFGNSYQTPWQATIPDRLSPLVIARYDILNQKLIPEKQIISVPTSVLQDGEQKPQDMLFVPVAMRLGGVNLLANDWQWGHAIGDISTFGSKLTPSLGIKNNLPYMPEGTWMKCGKLNITGQTNGFRVTPFLSVLSEAFSEANPKELSYAYFNYGYAIESADTINSIGTLSEYYVDSLKYFPVSVLKPWEPKSDGTTMRNRGTRTTASNLTYRYIRPLSTFLQANGLCCNFFVQQIPQRYWGDVWITLSSKSNKVRSSLNYRIERQYVMTTRSGTKVASTDEHGTSLHNTSSAITTLSFDVTKENVSTINATVPFGYVSNGIPTTYTVTVTPTGYVVVINTPTDGVYKGAVDVRHGDNVNAGYRHFFEITKLATTFRAQFGTNIPLIPTIAVNSLDPPTGAPKDDQTGTYVYCANVAHQVYFSWFGARTEPKQVFLMPVYNDPDIISTPLLNVQEISQTPQVDATTWQGTITYANGFTYPTKIINNDYFANANPISFATWKASVPQGFSWATLSMTNQARRTSANNEFVQYSNLNIDLPPGSKQIVYTMAQCFNRSQKLRTSTNAVDFQQTSTPTLPAGSWKCPADDIGYFQIPNTGKVQQKSLMIYFQGVIALYTTSNTEVNLHGCDINATAVSCVQIPEQCLIVNDGSTWEFRIRKPTGGDGKAHSVTILQIGS
jgi:hypothetical protein